MSALSNRLPSKKFNVDDVTVTKPMIEVAQQLVITGSLRDAANTCNVPYDTIRNWLSVNEDFKKLLEKFTEVMISEMKAELVGYSRQALEVEREIMLNSNMKAKDRLSAAQDILDRAGLVSKKQQQVDINNNYNYFANLPDEELDKIIDVEFTFKEDADGQTEKGATGSGEVGEVEKDVV